MLDRVCDLEEELAAVSERNQQARLKACTVAATEGEVLQTQTVSLSEVRRDIHLWKKALQAEYESLTQITGAVKPIHKSEVKDRTDVEYAPGKLVATIKSPDGRRKARIVVCGNLVEPSLDEQLSENDSEHDGQGVAAFRTKKRTFDTYASGVDGTTVRATLRKAAAMKWSAATTDVRTAFLLAPRREQHGVLVVKPPRVLVDANIISADEYWLVTRALYGLQTSPADWSVFRDNSMQSWSWRRGEATCMLRSTPEPNLWQVVEKEGEGDARVRGYLVVYVDDVLAVGPRDVIESTLAMIQRTWKCAEPSWITDPGGLKFCGFEIEARSGGIYINQKAYAQELCERHQVSVFRSTPMSSATAAMLGEESEEESRPEVKWVRRAQAVTGELLWLSIRTRPDLAFAVNTLGRIATKRPHLAVRIGEEILSYIYTTQKLGIFYGECRGGDGCGAEGGLALPRSMRRVECFADISFAPQAEKSVQGVIGTYGGAPIQWESNRQTCCALSTAEAELYGYVEAMTMAENIESIVGILEEVPVVERWKEAQQGEDEPQDDPLGDEGHGSSVKETIDKVVYGDNTAAIAVLCSPDGPWRTRHLRLRSQVLRERLKCRTDWKIRHLPGSELVADFLTKPINPRAKWEYFFKFLGMVGMEEYHNETRPDKEQKGEGWCEIAKIAVAGAGMAGLVTWKPESKEARLIKDVCLVGLTAFMASRVARLQAPAVEEFQSGDSLAVEDFQPEKESMEETSQDLDEGPEVIRVKAMRARPAMEESMLEEELMARGHGGTILQWSFNCFGGVSV